MNWSSAVIVRLIVRYVPVDLEALLYVIYVDMCMRQRWRENTMMARKRECMGEAQTIHLHCIISADSEALVEAV